MKTTFLLSTVVSLATSTSLVQAVTPGTNGVIYIATRAPQDTQFGTEFVSDEKGPGMVTPGDVAMGNLLGDHGYTFRLLLDRLLSARAADIGADSAQFLQTALPDFAPRVVIMSGSSSSADTPPPPAGVAVAMGEHVCLGNRTDRVGSIFMYAGQNSSDPNESNGGTKYMKVTNPDHPIMKGIPLDDQGRVKIFRDPYPAEESHVPPAGKRNFEYRWCTQVAADKAAGTVILGVLDGAEERACFAVMDRGGINAAGNPVDARRVHLFLNENGSGGSRRVFLALTDLGRLLFLRSVQWALGEELAPIQTFRILEVKPAAAAQQVEVSWEGSALKSYKLLASADLAAWHTVVEDIPGQDGAVRRVFDLAFAPKPLFLRIASVP